MKQIINLEFLRSKIPEMLFYLNLCDFSSNSSGKIIFQAAAILNCLIWRQHWELALAPERFGQSISKITSVPIFMLLYKFAHSLMRIPLTALTIGKSLFPCVPVALLITDLPTRQSGVPLWGVVSHMTDTSTLSADSNPKRNEKLRHCGSDSQVPTVKILCLTEKNGAAMVIAIRYAQIVGLTYILLWSRKTDHNKVKTRENSCISSNSKWLE